MSRAGACGRALIVAAAAALLATAVAAADDAIEHLATTTEFDYASRGKSKYGDSCSATVDCGFPGSVCETLRGECRCDSSLPATNHIDKCGRAVGVNESCFFNEQCQEMMERTECRNQRCTCLYEMVVEVDAEGQSVCVARYEPPPEPSHIDPAMIGVLVGMALMFVIICVVLRLFSRARWRENRTIFNTPNPRLMNVSLLRDTKLHAQDGRRGSRVSMRPPSRQPSLQELRSPVQGSRRGSRASSNMSASTRSSKSPTEKAPNNHHASHPSHPAHPTQIMFESVTIEVQGVNA